jgi:hypothetical protein
MALQILKPHQAKNPLARQGSLRCPTFLGDQP